MLKRFIASLVLAALAVQSSGAGAADLDSAFGSLVGTTDAPGMYSTGTRTAFVAGGIDVRFPRASTTVNVFSITPPTLAAAGCAGISAHFGGFSFVSGKQIEQLIQNIAQGAVGMVVSVVIKTLCPICDAVIQAMTKLAQDAARMSINSCQMGANLAKSLMAQTGTGGDPEIKNMCTGNVTTKGVSSDALSAVNGIDSACGSLQKSIRELSSALELKSNPDGTKSMAGETGDLALARQQNLVGNLTWNEMNEVFGPLDNATDDEKRNRELLLNVLGTEIVAEKGADGKPVFPRTARNATISGKNMFDLFMCGAPTSWVNVTNPANGAVSQMPAEQSVIKTGVTSQYCGNFYTSGDGSAGVGQTGGFDYKVWSCMGDYEKCADPKEVDLKDAQMLRGAGFLPQTELLLSNAVEAVRTNKAGGFDPKFIELTRTVNFPIYQAINAAAVYPASTADLLSTMSVLVAESLVTAKLEEMLRPQGRYTKPAHLSRETAKRIYDVMENIQKGHKEQRATFGRMMAMQEAAMQSIRQVNIAIQKQVLTPQLLGNQKFGSAVAGSVAPGTQP